MVKILILDIETAPKIAYVWRFFKENVGVNQVLHNGHIMSFAAKWYGDDTIFFHENRKEDDSEIIAKLIAFLDEADIVVAHNGERFDSPQIIGRALVNGYTPPSPYKIVDTFKVARKEFGFPKNSLEYIAEILECSPKMSHKKFPGFELWLECLRGNEEAWEEMKTYNIQDVITLEEVYAKMLPYIKNHPNVANYNDSEKCSCATCGSEDLVRRGFAHTRVGKYQRYRCNSCGAWNRGRFTVKDKDKSKVMLTQVAN